MLFVKPTLVGPQSYKFPFTENWEGKNLSRRVGGNRKKFVVRIYTSVGLTFPTRLLHLTSTTDRQRVDRHRESLSASEALPT